MPMAYAYLQACSRPSDYLGMITGSSGVVGHASFPMPIYIPAAENKDFHILAYIAESRRRRRRMRI